MRIFWDLIDNIRALGERKKNDYVPGNGGLLLKNSTSFYKKQILSESC